MERFAEIYPEKRSRKPEIPTDKKHKRNKINRLIALLSVLAVVAVILLIAADSRLVVRTYTIETEKIDAPIRIALITDLHSCSFGENQKELVEAIEDQSPDILLLGGDIFDDVQDNTNSVLFLSAVSGKYPCYYVTGNHEYWSTDEDFASDMRTLKRYGITILTGTYETLTVNNQIINICGVNDPDAFMINKNAASVKEQLDSVNKATQNGRYTILLSHRPEYFKVYARYDFDLVLCGHAHGGQWRIPMLLNGIYAPNQGLFPEYAGGRYDAGNTTMIVSRGLARETTRIPRIFNRPELVIVEIK